MTRDDERSPTNPDALVAELNRTVRDYLEHALDPRRRGFDARSRSGGTLAPRGNQQRCWQMRACPDPLCPARDAADYRCWLRVGPLSGCTSPPCLKLGQRDCFGCEVYRSYCSTPYAELYENVNILVHHMEQRAEDLRRSANTDPLTGLFNRRMFGEVAGLELARAERERRDLAVLVLDLDQFKDINDRLGHAAGDRALQACAELLRASFRRCDMLFRMGGDEFTVLQPVDDDAGALRMVERLRQGFHAWNHTYQAVEGFSLAFSAGVALCPPGGDIEAALRSADRRMYRQKAGRHTSPPARSMTPPPQRRSLMFTHQEIPAYRPPLTPPSPPVLDRDLPKADSDEE